MSPLFIPPKPTPRPDKVSMLRYLTLFRRDILSAQPARLYRAWMAEFRTPFFRSFLCNDPALIDRVLKDCPADFPKSWRVNEGLRPLLRNSVFVTNGPEWEHQRRIIDPAFEHGRLHDTFPAMWAAGRACAARLRPLATGIPIDIEPQTSHAAADVIFRTLFSLPIEDQTAQSVFQEFQSHQRAQPIVNLGAFVPLPKWFPRFHSRRTRNTAARIRTLIENLTKARATQIAAGTAPDDLATKIMTTPDPQTGQTFDTTDMVDQVAIFFLAGHETSASALAWSLYLLAHAPDWQARLAREATLLDEADPEFAVLARLKVSRSVFREALRLYPPVPMMVRESRCPVRFRDRAARSGDQVVLSPWHLHRHERLWQNPDAFDPARWNTPEGKASARKAYIPFSAGPRVCPGAGFAMAEGPLLLSMIVRAFEVSAPPDRTPVPAAHLTVRSSNGIWLSLRPRDTGSPQ